MPNKTRLFLGMNTAEGEAPGVKHLAPLPLWPDVGLFLCIEL